MIDRSKRRYHEGYGGQLIEEPPPPPLLESIIKWVALGLLALGMAATPFVLGYIGAEIIKGACK